MIPTLNVRDLLVILNNLRIGDIIVFKLYGVTRSGHHLTIVLELRRLQRIFNAIELSEQEVMPLLA